jgi:beta-galactosidase
LSIGPVSLRIDGPASIVGPSLLSLVGGVAAVWIQAGDKAGTVTLTATHAELGTQALQIEVRDATPDVGHSAS